MMQRILIIDDDHHILLMIKKMLERAGFEDEVVDDRTPARRSVKCHLDGPDFRVAG